MRVWEYESMKVYPVQTAGIKQGGGWAGCIGLKGAYRNGAAHVAGLWLRAEEHTHTHTHTLSLSLSLFDCFHLWMQNKSSKYGFFEGGFNSPSASEHTSNKRPRRENVHLTLSHCVYWAAKETRRGRPWFVISGTTRQASRISIVLIPSISALLISRGLGLQVVSATLPVRGTLLQATLKRRTRKACDLSSATFSHLLLHANLAIMSWYWPTSKSVLPCK